MNDFSLLRAGGRDDSTCGLAVTGSQGHSAYFLSDPHSVLLGRCYCPHLTDEAPRGHDYNTGFGFFSVFTWF